MKITQLLIFLLIFLASFFVFTKLTARSAHADWFNSGWSYRTAYTISNSGAADANKKVLIQIDTATLNSAGKLQSACQDSRFTDVNGNLLQYYVNVGGGAGVGCTDASTDYYVLVPVINASSTVIYHYYGNPSAPAGTQSANFSQATFTPASLSAATEEPSVSPIAYWSLDEASGQTVNNSVSSTTNGTLGANTNVAADDPTWKDSSYCISGPCLYFDGNNSTYVNVSNTIKNVKTVSFWFKTNTSNIGVLSLNGAGNAYLAYTSNTFQAGPDFISPTIYYNGQVTSTYDHNTWVNVTVTTNTAISATNIMLGKVNTTYYTGFIDEVKLYDKALTADQVKANYLAAAASINPDSSYLTSSLAAYWKMDEASWSNNCIDPSVKDSSGNNVWGRACPNLTGPTGGAVGKFGNAGSFTGTNTNRVEVPANSLLQISSEKTVSAWVNLSSLPSHLGDIVYMSDSGSVGQTYELNYDNVSQKFAFTIPNTANAWFTAYGPTTVSSGIWYHVVGVYKNKTITTYVNGIPGTPVVLTGTPVTGNSLLYMGESYTDPTTSFPGLIDEVRLYNKGLSASEVTNLYHWAPGPTGYWKMDENSGSATVDSSSSNITTTLTGTAVWTAGKYSPALSFDGSTQKVSATVTDPGYSNTIEAWVYPTTSAVSKTIITSGKLATDASSRPTYGSCVGTALSLNTWTHIAAVSTSSGSCNIYQNGVQTASNTTGVTFGTALTISDTTNGFIGTLDDVKLYNYPRSPAQILEDMNGGHPIGGSPVGSQTIYWPFDEGYGSGAGSVHNSAFDTTLTGNLTGAAWKTGTNCKINNCLSFTNTTENVSAGDVSFVDGLTGFSASFWLKPTTLAVDTALVSKWNNTTQDVFLVTTDHTTSSELRIYIASSLIDTGSNYYTTSGLGLANGTWNHITIVYDGTQAAGSKIKVYKDGIAVSGSTTGTIPANLIAGSTSNLTVGQAAGGFNTLPMTLDEFKFYSAALNQTDINIDKNAGSATSMGGVLGTQNNEGSAGNPPVAWWKFDENSGSTTVDSSGNNLSTTINNGPLWVAGKHGSALKFDGSSQSVSATITDPAYANTVEAWVYPTASVASKTLITAGKLTTDSSSQPVYGGCTGTPLPLNKWTYIVAVSTDTTHCTLYQNGVIVSGTTGVTFGTSVSIGASSFAGIIDDVKIYDYARSDAQAAYDYNRGAPVVYYNFDECSGTVLHDTAPQADPNLTPLNGTIYPGTSGGNNDSVGSCNSGATDPTNEMWNAGTSGKYSGSLSFDGFNDYVSVTDAAPLQLTKDFTFSVWVYRKSSVNEHVFIRQTYLNSGYGLDIWNDSLDIMFYGGGIQYDQIGIADVPLNKWVHIAAVKSGFKITGYINGVPEVFADALRNTITPGVNNLEISSLAGSTPFDGKIDEFRIYNYALSAAQIKTLYTNGSVYFGP